MHKPSVEKNEAEVIVVGAGLAGICAAVAAARRGRQVLIVEQTRGVGGAAAVLHHPFLCGLYPNTPDRPRGVLNPGLTEEACARIAPREPAVRRGRVWLLPCAPSRLTPALAGLLAREKRIEILFAARVLDYRLEAGRIQSVRVAAAGRRFALAAQVFIDAGTGVLCRPSGGGTGGGREVRPLAGFALELSGVTWENSLPIRVPYLLAQAVLAGTLPLEARWTGVTPLKARGRVHLKLSLPAGTEPAAARSRAAAVVRTLRRGGPEFRRAKVLWRSPFAVDRDGETLGGRYRLKTRDVLECRRFEDAALRGAWPVEFWDPARGPVYRYPQGEAYDLPRRSLGSRTVRNLFAAGRSVSAEPGAQASLRAGGLCLASGEAAGLAADAYCSGERRRA